MRAISRSVAFALMGLLLALPVLGADDNAKKPDTKKTNAKKDSDKDTNSEKMVKAGVAVGKIMAVVESKKSIRLQVTFRVPKLNPGALNSIAQAQNRLAQARTPQALIQAQQSLAQAQAGLYTMTNVQKDYELQALDTVSVRMRHPPVQFDDKGRIKRYTKKELKELKGDDKGPGFPASFADLKQGQIVQVTLVKKKDAPRVPVRRGKDADPDLLAEYQPQMSQVVIEVEPQN